MVRSEREPFWVGFLSQAERKQIWPSVISNLHRETQLFIGIAIVYIIQSAFTFNLTFTCLLLGVWLQSTGGGFGCWVPKNDSQKMLFVGEEIEGSWTVPSGWAFRAWQGDTEKAMDVRKTFPFRLNFRAQLWEEESEPLEVAVGEGAYFWVWMNRRPLLLFCFWQSWRISLQLFSIVSSYFCLF